GSRRSRPGTSTRRSCRTGSPPIIGPMAGRRRHTRRTATPASRAGHPPRAECRPRGRRRIEAPVSERARRAVPLRRAGGGGAGRPGVGAGRAAGLGAGAGAGGFVGGSTIGSSPAARPGTRSRAGAPPRPARRARLLVRHIDPWSTLKFSLVVAVALFFVWLVA